MVFSPNNSGSMDGLDYFSPADTRPLSSVNADNRLLASAVRLRLEAILVDVVSPEQQGFLGGRSLIRNIVDVDDAMRAAALRGNSPAAIFFDFSAAFPSISQAFLRKVLVHLGFPAGIVNFADCLYFDNKCLIALGGQHSEGFCIKSGIRQGCPPRSLAVRCGSGHTIETAGRIFPGALLRAYGGDLAMVVEGFPDHATIVLSTFREYYMISGLQLNMKKVVVVPLWVSHKYCVLGEALIGPRGDDLQLIQRAVSVRRGLAIG